MRSVIFEVPATQFHNAPQYELGPVSELTDSITYGVWVVLQDTTGGTTPILTGWSVTGERKLILNLDESALQPTDTVVISIMCQDKPIPTPPKKIMV